jgi:hypothetical protein
MADRVETTCPCCNTKLVVHVATGEILAEERPKKDHDKSFENALSEVQSGSQRREDAFTKAFDKTQHLDEVLSEKFEEARKKAAKDPNAKRHNPFDFD